MKGLRIRAMLGMLQLFIILLALLFIPVWSFRYWQAWVFLGSFFGPVFAITVYLMKFDPKLLERRIKGGPSEEKQRSQKIIQVCASIAFMGIIVFPSLDHRFGWSPVPVWGVITGNGLVVVGLFIVFFVFRSNSFTAAVVRVEADQRVVSTGPYGYVRHPMYSGAFILLTGIPLALGSFWGLGLVPLIMAVIVWRLIDEEKFLITHLTGYAAYRQKVRYRLLPKIW